MIKEEFKEIFNKIETRGIDFFENSNLLEQTVALAESNLVTELASISVNDDSSEIKTIEINEDSIIAPYAISNGETWFAFAEANSDGIEHFKSFGTNAIGLEDWNGGGDKDYDDFIMKFDFNSVNA